MKLLPLLLFVAGPGWAQNTVDGDAWIQGKLGVGTGSPGARLEVVAGSALAPAFQVSGVDETPFLEVLQDGKLGLSTTPAAGLDVNGAGDVGDAGLALRSGNLYPATDRYQLTLSSGGSSNYRHAIRTVHLSSTSGNGLDFLLWEPGAGSSSSLPVLNVLSLVATSTGSRVHVMRSTETPDVELEVSDGVSTGGGKVRAAAEATHSSRKLKTDVVYLPPEARRQAFEEVKGLKHATYRYMRMTPKGYKADRSRPEQLGLIYEDAPESIRGPGKSISYDERLANAELALQELIRRLEADEGRAGSLGP